MTPLNVRSWAEEVAVLMATRLGGARRGLPLAWQLHTIEGIGHDGEAMSAVCAHLWFHHRLPDATQLAALAGRHTA